MVLPNYKNGSIVNLISTIIQSRGGRSKYNPLKILHPKEIKDAKNIVLLILDGFGMDLLKRHAKNSVFSKCLRGEMTPVFPSTTSAAMSTFYFGVPSQQHGLTAWYMHLKEFGGVVAILPFVTRTGWQSLEDIGIDAKKYLNQKSVFEKIKTSGYFINPKKIVNSAFSKAVKGKAKATGYSSLGGMFRSIKKAVRTNNKKKFIFAYWDGIDHLSHLFGPQNKKVKSHIKEIEKEFVKFLRSIEGTDTTVIVTADHGQIQCKKTIFLNDYPEIKECLAVPMCGEPRAAFMYVRPSKVKQFLREYNKHLKKYCTIAKSEDLIKKNYFGLGKAHKHLFDRIGDFILFPKGNYMIFDCLYQEERRVLKDNHGGLSKEEMLVPLMVVKT